MASAITSALMGSLRRPSPAVVQDPYRPPNGYERGDYGKVPIRLCVPPPPTLRKLVNELQRPSARAREMALEILQTRIDDPETRDWLMERIAAGDFRRIHWCARPGSSEESVLAGWKAEAETAKVEALKEAEELAKEQAEAITLKPRSPK